MRSELPEGWTAGCLGDVVSSIRSGVSVNSEDRETRTGELGVLKTSCVSTGVFRATEHKTVVTTELERVAEPVAADTVIVSRMNTPDLVGASGYVDTPFPHLFLPDRLWAVRAVGHVSARWLAYLIADPAMRSRLKSAASGTSGSMKNLSQESFLALPVSIPPLAEQRRIVAVLEVWDRAIDWTDRLVLAKRRRLRDVRRLLLSDLAEPEVELSQLGSVRTGVPAPQNRDAFAADGIRFVRVSDLASFCGEHDDEPEYLTPSAASAMRRFPSGTVLFAKSGMSCKLDRIVRLPTEACLVSHLGAVNAHHEEFQSFLYHWIAEHPPSMLIQGDGFPSIRITEVAAMSVPGVSIETAKLLGELLDYLERDVSTEVARLNALRTQKVGLMQKLLTGEYRLAQTAGLPPA